MFLGVQVVTVLSVDTYMVSVREMPGYIFFFIIQEYQSSKNGTDLGNGSLSSYLVDKAGYVEWEIIT